MIISVENLQDKVEVTREINSLLERTVETSFGIEDFKIKSEVSFMFVDNEKIREFNKEYREIDKATDVLSFPIVDMDEGKLKSTDGDYDMDENVLLLGDIIISLEMTERQADEYGHSFERELAFLITHGIFHLLGYDHQDKNQEEKMIAKQEAVLKEMGLQR